VRLIIAVVLGTPGWLLFWWLGAPWYAAAWTAIAFFVAYEYRHGERL